MMDSFIVDELVEKLQSGSMDKEDFKAALYSSMVKEMEEASIDLNREQRQGFPEVVYCEGKTDEQCVQILKELEKKYDNVIGTRARASTFNMLEKEGSSFVYHELSGMLYLHRNKKVVNEDRIIAVVAAGTSDLRVAEEAALTAEIMGNEVRRIYDVGVAGIHRLFHKLPDLKTANVVIVVAGMEGALASVVGGLLNSPIIAVPTSVGYGASFHGLAALLAMLNSCAAGVGVVNIDNGFGAGRLAHIINSRR